FSGLHCRQPIEYRRTAFRIIGADDLAGRLVIDQHARRALADLALNQLAVDAHLIGWQNTLTDMRGFTIDRYATGNDQLFHVATRSQSGLSQHLVQFRRIVFCRQIAANTFLLMTTLAAMFVTTGHRIEGFGCHEGKNIVGIALFRMPAVTGVLILTSLLLGRFTLLLPARTLLWC